MEIQDIHDEIRREHDELRVLLQDCEGRLEMFRRDAGEEQAEAGEALRAQGEQLYTRFAAHIDNEQELLEPVLTHQGGTGSLRARRLRREHDEQRQLLDFLLGRLRQQARPTTLIARELQAFVDYLREDMAHEEETLLRD